VAGLYTSFQIDNKGTDGSQVYLESMGNDGLFLKKKGKMMACQHLKMVLLKQL